jgi:steroid 5-alpha reductase family enzyme
MWGIRLAAFLLMREYVMWPALHQKIVELQSRMSIPFASKLLCWFVYSFFYVSLMSQCWSRLIQASLASSDLDVWTPTWNCLWGPIGYTGILLQLSGLALESIADWQKTSFKKERRHAWCNIGVWQWSTHPHYLGEGMFWIGTYLAHGFHSVSTSALATIGLGFILTVLKGAARSLATKQKEKYGQHVDFCAFQRNHNVFGTKSGLLKKERNVAR